MATFLTDDWFRAVEVVRADFTDLGQSSEVDDLVIDLRIDDAPSGPARVTLAPGPTGFELQPGVVTAETTVTMPYEVARAFFVDGDFLATVQAFTTGQILVEGDLARLMALDGSQDPRHQELQARIRAVTD